MSGGIARSRLAEERKSWRRNHPHLETLPDGSLDLMIWRCHIPEKPGILFGIQDLLNQPNLADPAQTEGYHIFMQDTAEYKRRVREQAKLYPALV